MARGIKPVAHPKRFQQVVARLGCSAVDFNLSQNEDEAQGGKRHTDSNDPTLRSVKFDILPCSKGILQ